MINKTTQEILNRIEEIKKEGNWIESPYRQITWIPSMKCKEAIKQARQSSLVRIKDIVKGGFGLNANALRQYILNQISKEK